MAFFTKNLGLKIWNNESDKYNYQELARNWIKVEEHDHTTGRGKQIPSAGIADGAITKAKLASGIVSEIASQINFDTVTAIGTSKINDAAVTDAKLSAFSKVPIGTILPWWDWKKATDFATIQINLNAALGLSNSDINSGRLPWRICNGSVLGGNQHDFGTGEFTLPNLQNMFLIGSSSTVAHQTTGGVSQHDLSHNHNIDHVHTIPGHVHSVPHLKMPNHTHGSPGTGDFIVKGGSNDNKYLYFPSNKNAPASWPDYLATTRLDSNSKTDLTTGGVANKSFDGYVGTATNLTKSGDQTQLTSSPKSASSSDNAQLTSGPASSTANAQLSTVDNRPPFTSVVYIMKVLKTP